MSPKQFFAGLAITSFAQIVICFLLITLVTSIGSHGGFVVVTIASMIIFSIMLYGAARIYARSSLVQLYIQLIMIAVFLKMLLCLALIIGYKKGFEPIGNGFIWPFLLVYLTSTIYEVIFMEKVGREKQKTKI
ncbi:MAG: hypothetical protein M3R25_05140 [Bacteroidota bacterium]|nr:hypothetical protein [Bacteroidota bacterium]